ncbi:MAG: tetratricopeptide repeat protein [Bacteroidia bacterium]
MKIKYFLIILFGLSACIKPQEKLFKQIKNLEKSEDVSSPESQSKLADLHKEYGLLCTDSLATQYLYSSGYYFYYTAKNNSEAEAILTEFVSRSNSNEQKKNAQLILGQIHMQYEDYELMAKDIKTAIDLAPPTNTQWNEIRTMFQTKIKANAHPEPSDYELLAKSYTALSDFNLALANLDSAISQFPNYPGRSKLIYRAGFISWEYMKNAAKARAYYETFLESYPEDGLAKEVKTILESGWLDMSDEDILEDLKKGI